MDNTTWPAELSLAPADKRFFISKKGQRFLDALAIEEEKKRNTGAVR